MRTRKMQVNVCAGLALLTAGVVFSQTAAAPPAFEVASVKPAPPPTEGKIMVQMGGDPGMVDYLPDEREGGGMMAKMKAMAEAASLEAHGDPLGPNGLSLFGALQEKLGLRMEARKSPVDIVVVDSAQQVPTEN